MAGRIVRPDTGKAMTLPRVGMVRTGFKNDKGYPQSCDYFIPTGKYKDLFTKHYGDKPNTIQVVFWDDDIETMCNERYEYRDNQGKLYAKGDGEIFEVWDSKNKKYQNYSAFEHPDIMEKIHDKVKNKKGWDVILTLKFIVPKIKEIAGYWEFSTKGVESTIPAIRDTFDMMLGVRGSVRGVIFDLNVQFAKSQKPGVSSRYPVVNLVPNQSEENINAVKGTMLNMNNDNLLSE